MNIKLYRLIFCCVLLMANAFSVKAQKPEFQLLFEGIGDNREFGRGPLLSQTILGTLGAFELRFTANGHNLTTGLSHLFEFGSNMNYHKPNLIFYYQFEDKSKSFHFGSFPRRSLVDFPLAMLTDTLMYFRPNIEGMRGEYRWEWGHQNLWVDWTGRKTDVVREAFTAANSGEFRFSNFFVQNYILLNHLAHSKLRGENDHINDNFGYSIMAGWRSPSNTSFSGYLKAGILGSVYRERSVSDGFIHAKSLIAESYLKAGNLALWNTLHAGKGHILTTGDPFYRVDNYLRADAIWHFINHKQVKGRFNLSFHLSDWKYLDHSQQISIIYILTKI